MADNDPRGSSHRSQVWLYRRDDESCDNRGASSVLPCCCWNGVVHCAVAETDPARDRCLVMSCQSMIQCAGFEQAVKKREDRILNFGAFEFDGVSAAGDEHSAGVVYHVQAAN